MDALEMRDPRGGTWRVRVAVTRRERARGLLGAPPPPRREALLLPRARWVHTVGMHTTILVAHLDRSFHVVRTTAVPPGRLVAPPRRARHVLEAAVGADLRRGDALAILRSLPPGRGRVGSGIARAPIV